MDCRHIFLIGFMGAGKSSVARTIRWKYGMDYIEMDRKIEENAGMSVSRIFSEMGESAFRQMETDLLKSFSSESGLVVSCGGGVPLKQENVDIMKSQGKIVFLAAEPETIFARVHHRHTRPLLEGNMNVEYISRLLEERLPRYLEAADLQIATDGKSLEKIAGEIMKNTGMLALKV